MRSIGASIQLSRPDSPHSACLPTGPTITPYHSSASCVQGVLRPGRCVSGPPPSSCCCLGPRYMTSSLSCARGYSLPGSSCRLLHTTRIRPWQPGAGYDGWQEQLSIQENMAKRFVCGDIDIHFNFLGMLLPGLRAALQPRIQGSGLCAQPQHPSLPTVSRACASLAGSRSCSSAALGMRPLEAGAVGHGGRPSSWCPQGVQLTAPGHTCLWLAKACLCEEWPSARTRQHCWSLRMRASCRRLCGPCPP